jgi:AcrR family transcriptional regulator
MTINRRAITEEQKKERREMILQSALNLFHEFPYQSLTMTQIAAEAGIAKGTLFLYFETKEELFLALSWREYEKCFTKIVLELRKYYESSAICSLETFLDILRDTYVNSQDFLRLIAIGSVILEQNVGFESALNFKLMLAKQNEYIGMLLEKIFPFLRQGEGKMLLLQIHAITIGIQHLAEPTSVIKQVINDERLGMFRINFNEFFLTTIRVFLMGLEARGR